MRTDVAPTRPGRRTGGVRAADGRRAGHSRTAALGIQAG